MKKWLKCLAALLFGAMISSPAMVQGSQWPGRTVTIVVPYPPGSSNDMLGRLLADSFSKKFNKTFVVENRPGASGAIGIGEVARAKPDGYTVLLVSNSMVTNLTMPDQINHDVFRDFEPVSMVATMPIVMIINPKVPAKNVQEFIELAKKEPGKYKYGSSGVGSPHQLTSELFQSLTNTDLLHVPYKGQSPIITDLLGGRLDAAFVTLGPVLQYIESRRLTAMGMVGEDRSSLALNIPTLKEEGVEGLDMGWWLGMFVPKNTSKEIVQALADETADLIRGREFQQNLTNISVTSIGSTPEEFRSSLQREIETWQQVAKKAGIGS